MEVRAWVQHVRGGLRAHSGPMPEPRLDSLDYEAYWLDRGVAEPSEPPPSDPWDRPRFEAIAELLPPRARIVDLGCGDGSLLAFLRNRGWMDLMGVDVSERAIAGLRARDHKAIASSLEELDFRTLGEVDVAIFSEVLEHVVTFEAVLARAVEHSRMVIVSHPNIGFWPHRLRLLRGRFPIQWRWHPGEHVRFLTVRDLLDLCARAGYRIIDLRAPVGVPSATLRERWPNLCADHVVVAIKGQRDFT